MRPYKVGEYIEYIPTDEERERYQLSHVVFYGEIIEIDRDNGILSIESVATIGVENKVEHFYRKMTILEAHKVNKLSFEVPPSLRRAFKEQTENETKQLKQEEVELGGVKDRLSPRSDGEPPQPPADPPLVVVEGSSDEGVPGGGAEPSDQQVVEVPEESEGGTVEIDCQHSPDQRGESTDQSEKNLAQNNDTSEESQQISAEIPQSPGKLLIKDGKEKAEKRKRNKDPAAVESLRNTNLRRTARMHKPKAANVRYVEENGVWRQIVDPVTVITEDQSIIMFGRERPTKKQAREAGIRYWKQFNKNRKLTKLYSSSDDDADESKDESESEETNTEEDDQNQSDDSSSYHPESAPSDSETASEGFTTSEEELSQREECLQKKNKLKKSIEKRLHKKKMKMKMSRGEGRSGAKRRVSSFVSDSESHAQSSKSKRARRKNKGREFNVESGKSKKKRRTRDRSEEDVENIRLKKKKQKRRTRIETSESDDSSNKENRPETRDPYKELKSDTAEPTTSREVENTPLTSKNVSKKASSANSSLLRLISQVRSPIEDKQAVLQRCLRKLGNYSTNTEEDNPGSVVYIQNPEDENCTDVLGVFTFESETRRGPMDVEGEYILLELVWGAAALTISGSNPDTSNMRLGEKVNLRNGSSYTIHIAESAIITFKCSLPSDESFIDIAD